VMFYRLHSYDPKKTILASCTTGLFYTDPTIYVDPDMWVPMSLVTRELMMFHELGHCVLHRGHVESIVSVMNATLMDTFLFTVREKELLMELFDPSKTDTLGHDETKGKITENAEIDND